MAILTDAQRATLAAELAKPAYAGLSDRAAADALNATPPVANPTPQGSVPKPFGATTLTLAIDASRRATIEPYLAALATLVAAQDSAGIAQWAAELVLLGILQQADADAVNAVLSATMPDPSWPAQVHGPNFAQANFPGVAFRVPTANLDPSGNPVALVVRGQVTPEMVAEARGV